MRTIACVVLLAVVAAAQSYPPPFPRTGASKLLDNPRVQVWDVSWPKGQPTALHRHPFAMTGVYYASGDRMITAVDGSKRPVTTKAGGIVWQLKGLTHTEEGTSDEPLRAVMVELKGDGPSGAIDRASDVPAFTAGSTPLLDNERVTVWEYPGTATLSRHRHTRDTVVVWTESGAGRAIFLPAGTVHTAEAISAGAKATIFELK
jgi:quercetin dioxygenase-like cupin family protein